MTTWRKFKTIYLKVYTDNRHWILWLFLKIWKNPLFRFVVLSWLKLHEKYNFAVLCHEQLCNASYTYILDCPLSMSPSINQLIIKLFKSIIVIFSGFIVTFASFVCHKKNFISINHWFECIMKILWENCVWILIVWFKRWEWLIL